MPVASTNDTIGNNTVSGNYKGCGIIVEGWVPGAGVSGTTVSNNHITGAPGVFGPHGPVIGQIIVRHRRPGRHGFQHHGHRQHGYGQLPERDHRPLQRAG